MPGRKSIFFISAQTTIPNIWPGYPGYQADAIVTAKMNALADEALRAGVVIHTLDIRGLGLEVLNAEEKELPFSKKTGGIFLKDNNFFVSSSGIGRADEELKGYYILSYIPPPNTFKNEGARLYHRIRIKVKRPGSEVHSGDGFYGIPNPSRPPSAPESTSLQAAIFFPFKYNDLNVSLASGYAHAPKPGYFLRSWLHLDAKDVTFIDEKDDSHSISLQLVTLTVDSYGNVQDFKGMQYDFNVKNENIPLAKKRGLDFDFYLPVKNPGAYYVRAAIRDRASGKTGSAYQFQEIPDLKKHHLALSSIFIFNHDEDLSKIKSGNIEDGEVASSRTQKFEVIPKSAALRSYKPGDSFDYLAMIYNAKSKGSAEPQLESQYILFRDGKEYSKGNIEAVEPHGTESPQMIPIAKRLTFGKMIEEGNYVLQLQVRDKQSDKKSRKAVQAIDFEIHKGPADETPGPTASR